MMKDPRLAELREMPFDGKRMMWGGCEELLRADAAQGTRNDTRAPWVDRVARPLRPGDPP
jgi:hypothetical protein